MIRAVVERWSAWAPDLEDEGAWRRFASAPKPLSGDRYPEAKFMPALLRRRCNALTRTMLTAAHDCTEEGERDAPRTVFASRHGSLNDSMGMLRSVVRGESISPALFSHTVHNAQAGLFSIASGNQQASSSAAARADTFACAYVEALGHLFREPGRRVLVTVGDVPLDPMVAPLVPEPAVTYAVALLLSTDGAGEAVDFELTDPPPREPGSERRGWPDAIEFLRWLLAGEPTLTLGELRCGYRWVR